MAKPAQPFAQDVFALYSDERFAGADPEFRAKFLTTYFDQNVAPGLAEVEGVNMEDSKRRFVESHTLGPGYDPEVAGLYAQRPDFAAQKPKAKEKFLGALFDQRRAQDGQYVDPDTLKDARSAFIARNLTDADRHELYGVVSFAKDTLKELPGQVLTTLARAGRQGLGFLDAHMREGALSPNFEPTNMISADGAGMVDRRVAAQERKDTVSELRYAGHPVLGRGDVFDPIGAKQSMGYGLSSNVPAAGLGLAFGAPGALAGAALSAPVTFLATRDQFLSDAVERAQAAMQSGQGRRMTQEEVDTLVKGLGDAASRYGAWESIPEAVSNAIFGSVLGGGMKKLLPGGGKLAKLARGGLGLGVDTLGEHAGETATGFGQGAIDAETGARKTAPTLGEAFKEQFPQTNAMIVMHQGGATVAGKVMKPALARLGREAAPAPGEHRDLLHGAAPASAQKPAAAQQAAGEGPYSEEAVSRRYQEEHAVPFPSASELMRQEGPEVRPAQEPAQRPGLGLWPREPQDLPGYSEDAVRRRYEEGHAAPFPTAEQLSPPVWGDEGGQRVIHVRGEGGEAASYVLRTDLVPRADGKPFPTRRAAESQAAVLRRQGAEVAVQPGEGGGFVIARTVAEPMVQQPAAAEQPQPLDVVRQNGQDGVSNMQPGVAVASANEVDHGRGEAQLGDFRDGAGAQGVGRAEAGIGGEQPAGAHGIGVAQDARGTAAGRQPAQPAHGALAGRKRDVIAASGAEGERFGARYELRELSGLIASHDPLGQFAKTSGYPEGVQDRPYHSSRAHQDQVLTRAAKFDPDHIVNTSATAESGPSIVTADGVVLGGNNRKMLLDIVSSKHPERYAKYVEALRAEAASFGLRPEDVDAMRQPVLVRALDFSSTDKTPQELGRISGVLNKPTMTGQDRVSKGVAVAKGLDEATLGIFAAGVGGYDTLRDYLSSPHAVQQLVPALERNGVLDLQNRDTYMLDDRLTPEGKNSVEDALRGFVIPDNDLLQRLRRAGAEEMRSLDFALPHLAFLKAAGEEWVSGAMSGVVRLLLDYNANRRAWAEKNKGGARRYEPDFYLRQPTMLADVGDLRRDPLVVEQFRALVSLTPREFAGIWKGAAEHLRELKSRPVMPGMTLDTAGIRRIAQSGMAELDQQNARAPRTVQEQRERELAEAERTPTVAEEQRQPAQAEQEGAEEAPAVDGDRHILPQGVYTVASRVISALQEGRKITPRDIQKWANGGFGGTMAEGKWTSKEAYDAMEMGVNAYLVNAWLAGMRPFNAGVATAEQLKTAVAEIQSKILDKLPTQTRRSEQQMEMQQFSTPPHLAALAVWAGAPRSGEVVLEPSAGIGGLAVFARNAGAEVHANELDPRRRAMLKHMRYAVTGENAEQIHNILPESLRPTLVVMNPPFSSTAGRKQGERKTSNVTRHLDQALARLEDGGRLVAILSQGMSADKAHMGAWWKKTRQKYTLRANVKLDGAIYKKYGTSYDNLLVVIDKVPPKNDTYVNIECKTLGEAIDALGEVRDERIDPAELGAREQAGQGGAEEGRADHRAGEPVRPATGPLGAGERQAEGGGLPAGELRGDAAVPAHPGVGDEGAAGAVGRRRERSPRGPAPGLDAGAAGQRGVAEPVGEPGGAEPGLPGRGEDADPARAVEVEAAAQDKASGQFTDSLFEPYRPQRIRVKGSKPHPSPLVQSAAMAAVSPPPAKYAPVLPPQVVSSGALSEAQLEQVVYAGQAHGDMLPDGNRRGYFIGDGTGVGKGREIAGIILDNWNQGRKKAVWITFNSSLFPDAQRDMKGIGDDARKLFKLSATPMGTDVGREDGVLFTTYATLYQTPKGMKSGSKGKGQKQTFDGGRLDQIVKWLGEDFDGVVAFDESHKMGNAIEMKGPRGKKEPSQQALAGVELQHRLPGARVVYISATGATEPNNLSYLERMGLWGEGSPFANKRALIDAIESGGVAAMELVSRDLKAMGGYMARTLSYDGVTYDRLEHKLTEYQRKMYDTYARAWQIVLGDIYEALEKTEQGKNSNAKSAALSLFWGNHQRFFGQVLTSMTMPSVLADIKAELEAGNSCVIQLTNTNEAEQERALENASINGEDLENLDITPRQMLMDYVRRAFPVAQFEEYTDEDGNTRSRIVKDANGSPVENREAAAMRDALLERLGALKVPGNPLDMIVEEIGPDMVAEVTGRSRRVIHGKEQKRGAAAANKETQDFMDGRRRVLVFSQAGGTGRSYHADRQARNQEKRIHYILQPGWRADAATQGLGRTHRSNEAQPPHYKLVTSDLKGHKRFTSSIARRLDQLGALTQGQRQTGSQGLFSAADNLEDNLANDAWVWLAKDIHAGKVAGVSYDAFVAQTGLVLEKKDESGNMVFTPPPVKQFLNRLLSMTVDFQNTVFEGFESRLRDVYSHAEESGAVDSGVQTMKAERIDVVGREVLHKDKRSGAETEALALNVHLKRDLWTTDRLLKERGEPTEGWVRNKNSGRVYALYSGGVRQNLQGELHDSVQPIGVTGPARRRSLDEIHENYTPVSKREAQEAWDESLAGMEKTEKRDRWLLTGMLLPIWDNIKGPSNVYRFMDSEGNRNLGRVLNRDEYNATRKALGLNVELPRYTPEEAVKAILKGRKLTLRGGYELEARRVSGEVRVEISGEPVAWQMDTLKKLGAFTEIINYKTRTFVPTGQRGVQFMERMLELHPLVDEVSARSAQGAGVHFSVPAEEIKPGAGMNANTLRGALQDMQKRAKNARPLVVVQGFEELPRRIKRKARAQGYGVIDGVYDPTDGKVYLVADAIGSRKHAVQIWMHEQCLHRGLRGLFGSDRRFSQFLRGVYESAGGRSAFREIADLYGFDLSNPADQLRAAEEYLAKLMEKVRLDESLTAQESRVWRKVVRFVKELLANLGARVTFTDEEIAHTLRDAVYWTFEGARDGAKDASLAHDLAEWSRQLEERDKGEAAPRSPLRLGRTPDVFVKLGVPDLPMVMFRGKLSRIEQEHGIAAAELERLPALLDAPLAVLDSATEAGTYVAVLDMVDMRGRQVRAAIHPDVDTGRTQVNLVASVYGQQNIQAWVDEQRHAGRLLYLDKKKGSPRLGDKSRLQLPGVAKAGSAEVRKQLLTDADIVKRNPEVKFSIPSRGQDADLDSALSKIGAPQTGVRERVKALGEQFKAGFEQGMFDRFASLRGVDEAAGAAKAEDSAYVAARMTTSLGDTMSAIMEHGAPIWRDGAVDVDGERSGFASIFEPVAGEVDRWCAWMVGKRAERLAAEGRENLFTAEEIQALKGLNAGREEDYDRVWRDYVRFKTRVLDFAQAAGVIDPEGRKVWERDDHIPFYRLTEDGLKGPRDKKGIASQTSGIKALKGGTANLGDPFQNIIRNFTHLVDAAVKNHAMDLAMRNAEAAGAATPLGLKWEAVRLSAGDMQSALRKVLGDKDAVRPLNEAERSSIQAVFHMVRPTGKDVVHVLRGGKPVYYQVEDRLLLDSLTAMNQAAWNSWAMNAARLFKRVLTRGVTATPEFMLRNLIRDTVSAWVIDGKNVFKPVLGSLRGVAKTLRQDADTVRMMAAGASFSGGYAIGHDPAAAKLMVDQLLKKHGIEQATVLNTPKKLAGFLAKGWHKWEQAGQAVENSTRAEVYAQLRKKGATHLEAAYEAKNIMDYSMRGSWPAIRFLCEVVPFFGARMVGLHRMGRGYMENPSSMLWKGGMIALASVMLYLANSDEPEYAELEDFDRDNYYHFWLDGEHYRLPKPFESGALFGTLPERITQQFVDDEATGALFADRLLYMLTQTFNVGLPQIAAPVMEQWADKVAFTGRPIVGRRLARLRPEEQREPWTSPTMIELGRATGASPKRLEHLVTAYFGTMGSYVLAAADMATEGLYDHPEAPARRTSDLPVLRAFYRDGEPRHIRQGEELYDMLHEVQQLRASVLELRRGGDMERAQELLEQNKGKIALHRAAGQVERQLAEFSKQARLIHASRTMDMDEKAERLETLIKKRNEYIRRAYSRMRERVREE